MRWEVEQTDTGWAVNGYSRERMRICADGTLKIYGDEPVESYPYITEEWAEVGRKYAVRLDSDPYNAITFTTPLRLPEGGVFLIHHLRA